MIQDMVKEAAEREADDKARREEVGRKNNPDNLCYSVEKVLRENKDKLRVEAASQIEALVEEGKQAVGQQDDGMIASVTDRLEKKRIASQARCIKAAVRRVRTNSRQSPRGGGNEGRKDVIDAEFEETQHGHP